MDTRRGPKRQVSEGRKLLYYLGNGIALVGVLLFLSVFVTFAMRFGDFTDFAARGRNEGLRAVFGMIMIIGGGALAGVGKAGLAGSGVVLDPEKAREDVEPWSRMSGGVLRDTLDEAGIDLSQIGSGLANSGMPFDEKLRRLHALYEDGILTEAEYQREKQQLLNAN